ncbi:MAG: peptide-methionine (S)-S-oxide reductase MsrA [Henriciella sp.]|uniref:peptide-methionine (S)-S-oxide reductase MsrA n=1 Tax=Henriciella sp. TaxID=1968823 RepID=UPI003C77098C
MKRSQTTTIAALAGAAAIATGFLWSAVADQSGEPEASTSKLSTAIFAGGCFWCVEADFDKVDGVVSTVSGYTGGTVEEPTYKKVTYGDTGHYEAVKISYDPTRVSYEELVDHFFRTIDPTDPRGQFCDKGESYRTAVFVSDAEERDVVETEINEIEESGVLPGPVVTKVIDASDFWPAEDYHQDYYRTTPIKYRFYRRGCGRDAKLEKLWGNEAITANY